MSKRKSSFGPGFGPSELLTGQLFQNGLPQKRKKHDNHSRSEIDFVGNASDEGGELAGENLLFESTIWRHRSGGL